MESTLYDMLTALAEQVKGRVSEQLEQKRQVLEIRALSSWTEEEVNQYHAQSGMDWDSFYRYATRRLERGLAVRGG